jgi:hypothetical protein
MNWQACLARPAGAVVPYAHGQRARCSCAAGLVAMAACSSGSSDETHVSPQATSPASADDISSAARWFKAANLNLPSSPSRGLLCFYDGGNNSPVASVALTTANSKALADALGQSNTSSQHVSCPVDEGDRLDIYLEDGKSAQRFTLRFGGCHQVGARVASNTRTLGLAAHPAQSQARTITLGAIDGAKAAIDGATGALDDALHTDDPPRP